MKTCDKCKHWDYEKWEYSQGESVRKCNRMPMYYEVTDWNDDGDALVIKSDSLAFCQDASDYKAVLLTLPNFGCVMWEEK